MLWTKVEEVNNWLLIYVKTLRFTVGIISKSWIIPTEDQKSTSFGTNEHWQHYLDKAWHKIMSTKPQGLGASEKKKKNYYIILLYSILFFFFFSDAPSPCGQSDKNILFFLFVFEFHYWNISIFWYLDEPWDHSLILFVSCSQLYKLK